MVNLPDAIEASTHTHTNDLARYHSRAGELAAYSMVVGEWDGAELSYARRSKISDGIDFPGKQQRHL